jgi:histone deacetylase HOS2
MKPWRLTLTNKLVISYQMYTGMDMYVPRLASKEEMAEFHMEDYLSFLEQCVTSIVFYSFTYNR